MNNQWYIKEYNNDHIVYYKDSDGFEEWCEHDSNGKPIHWRNSRGHEQWYDHDEHGNLIHYKNSDGLDVWYDVWYDSNGNKITKEEYDRIHI